MKYVHFTIRSAKVTTDTTTGNRPDFGVTLKGVTDGEPIRFNNVSNALHVLLGTRPVSTKWNPFGRKRCEHIDNITEGALLKITTPSFANKKTETKMLPYEFVSGNKLDRDSNRNDVYTKVSPVKSVGGRITWDTLKLRFKYQRPERYEAVLKVFKDFTHLEKPWEEYRLIDVLLMMEKSDKVKEYIATFEGFGLTPFANIINEDTKYEGMAFNGEPSVRPNSGTVNLAAYSNNTSPIYKASINAELVVPMGEDDYSRLLNGTKFATFLENGVITFDAAETKDSIDEDDLLDEGYVKVSTLR